MVGFTIDYLSARAVLPCSSGQIRFAHLVQITTGFPLRRLIQNSTTWYSALVMGIRQAQQRCELGMRVTFLPPKL